MSNYDLMNFEALGAEAGHIEEEIQKAQAEGLLLAQYNYLITGENLQTYLAAHPDTVLPDIITTKTHSVPPAEYINSGKKKSIVTRSAGYDHLEHLQKIANITSLREYCVNAVAQTAIKMMYDCCGYLNKYTLNTTTFDRNNLPSFIELNESRVATVYGVGRIGKRTYELCVANGLTVQAVDVRAEELKKEYGDTVKFVSKEEAAENTDIVINVMNLTRIPESRFYNVGYFSEEYLRSFKKPLVFVNVTRGDIAPELTLLKLYKEGKILGIGVDVFSDEASFAACVKSGQPANENEAAAYELMKMAVERTGNVYVQPHQGFNSDAAALAKAHEAIRHVIAYYRNNGETFDEQLPYYL